MLLRDGDTITEENVRVQKLPQFGEALSHYNRENAVPWPCYLRLDLESGALYGTSRQPGNMPINITTGVALEWPIPAIPGATVDRLLDTVTNLAQDILDHAEITVPGNDADEYSGRILPGKGGIAYDRISAICDTLTWR